MPRYFLYVEFLGTAYNGWQSQPDGNTIQQKIERALGLIFKVDSMPIMGSGRTDAGVHASGQVAHFDVQSDIDIGKTQFQLNGILPKDIRILRIKKVNDQAHARFDAISRTYQYRLLTSPSPLRECTAWFNAKSIHVDLLHQCATLIPEVTDFSHFSKENPGNIGSVFCNIESACWKTIKDDEYIFEIKSNRFLRHMVRYLVGGMIKTATGIHSVDDFEKALHGKIPNYVHLKAPAHALCLSEVAYPNSIFQ